MKRLHLVCNAHLDPTWLWDWEEGVGCALATFRSAVRLAQEFDYVFCHNEALLYEWVEEYDPETFAEIVRLVAAGRWEIIGGWFLQPDCIMPDAESILRQIRTGRRYFREKFGKVPTAAVCFDAFGHASGLPQLLRKTGYSEYLCARPGPAELPVPDDFVWEGADGSRVRVCRVSSHYNSVLGQAAAKLANVAEHSEKEVDLVLWGVGNHGGGPSRKDLGDIGAYAASAPFEVLHSTPERYFADAGAPARVVHGSLVPCMPGCYTSQARVKRLHRELEARLALAEKLSVHAGLAGMAYPGEELARAERCLMLAEFHDILPGSGIRAVEEYGIQLCESGLETLRNVRVRAFYRLCAGQPEAKPGEFPILVYNPLPVEAEAVVDVGLGLEEQNHGTEFTDLEVFSGEERLPSQLVKEPSNIALDWMKRVLFRCRLKPMSMNRFDCRKHMLASRPSRPVLGEGENFVFESGDFRAVVSGSTGLLCEAKRQGRDYLASAVLPAVYRDNADPWAMGEEQRRHVGTLEGAFALMSPEEARVFSGELPVALPAVRLIEDGEVCSVVESLLRFRRSDLRIEYTFYKHAPEIGLRLELSFGEKDRMVRLNLPMAFRGTCTNEICGGREEVPPTGAEAAVHRYLFYSDGERCLGVLNGGTYGMSCEGSVVRLSLARSAAYAAHPIGTRPLTQEDRFTPRFDQGLREYSFRLVFGEHADVERRIDTLAQLWHEGAYALSVFPSGTGARPPQEPVTLDNAEILLTALREEEGGILLRLFNNHPRENECRLTAFGQTLSLRFGRFELKTVRFEDGVLREYGELLK